MEMFLRMQVPAFRTKVPTHCESVTLQSLLLLLLQGCYAVMETFWIYSTHQHMELPFPPPDTFI